MNHGDHRYLLLPIWDLLIQTSGPHWHYLKNVQVHWFGILSRFRAISSVAIRKRFQQVYAFQVKRKVPARLALKKKISRKFSLIVGKLTFSWVAELPTFRRNCPSSILTIVMVSFQFLLWPFKSSLDSLLWKKLLNNKTNNKKREG